MCLLVFPVTCLSDFHFNAALSYCGSLSSGPSYITSKPHFTAPSKLQDKADGVQAVPGNAQLSFQPSASAAKPPSLGGRGLKEVSFNYESKLAEVFHAFSSVHQA